MAINVEVTDPHRLILNVSAVKSDRGRTMIVLEYAESEPLYKLETEPLGAILTVKEGKSRRKAVLRFSGITMFRPRDLPNRTLVHKHGLRPDEPRTAARAKLG